MDVYGIYQTPVWSAIEIGLATIDGNGVQVRPGESVSLS